MDTAKGCNFVLTNGGEMRDYQGIGKAKKPMLPLIAIPTTAGTGSEATPVAVITCEGAEKRGVNSPALVADWAVLDADLTLGMPRSLTAATGIDAMVHAIEAYTSASPNNNPVSRALASEALRLLGRNIERAVHHGRDLEARSAMLLGSLLAGQAFANSPVAAVHALAYPIGGHFGVPHGLSNALVLPHVLRFNAPACAAQYAELLPHAFPKRAGGADEFVAAVEELSRACGLEPRLRDVGIPADAVPMMAEDAMRQTRLLVNNPQPLTLDDARAIYEAAW